MRHLFEKSEYMCMEFVYQASRFLLVSAGVLVHVAFVSCLVSAYVTSEFACVCSFVCNHLFFVGAFKGAFGVFAGVYLGVWVVQELMSCEVCLEFESCVTFLAFVFAWGVCLHVSD